MQRVALASALTGLLTEHNGATFVVQRDLATDLRDLVDVYGPPDYNAMLRLIRAASVADRQAAVADSALMSRIGIRFNRTYATILASALLEGTAKWKNPTDNDFFRFFVLGTGPSPASPSSTMNCWESIMFAAFLVGTVSKTWIKNFYVQALAQPDPTGAAYALLGYSTSLPTYDPAAGREPTPGQLVFYTTSGRPYADHVALYVGGGQVMSLWQQPRGVDHIQQVGITEISGTIRYGNAPW